MCARFSLYATPDQIAKLLDLEIPEVEARYNIAPTQMLLGAIERNGHKELREFRWGLIPSWAKDRSVGNKMINARAESLEEKSAFRKAFHKRRCVIPASGFFEWKHEIVEEFTPARTRAQAPSLFEEFDIPPPAKKKERTLKIPYFIGLKSGEPFGFAGLYEYWHDPAGEKVRSCTIVTTTPNELVSPLHDRMPVILTKDHLEEWLDCDHHDAASVEHLLRPLAADQMIAVPVSSAVNDPNNDSPDLVLAR